MAGLWGPLVLSDTRGFLHLTNYQNSDLLMLAFYGCGMHIPISRKFYEFLCYLACYSAGSSSSILHSSHNQEERWVFGYGGARLELDFGILEGFESGYCTAYMH